MKKLLFALLCIFAVACTQSPEKKAEELIKEEVLKSLYFPKTYEPIETKVDSAYSPFLDPEFMDLALELYKKGSELQSMEPDLRLAKSQMHIYDGPYRRVLGSAQYNDAKEKYDKLMAQYDAKQSQVVDLRDQTIKRMSEPPQFIGFLTQHSYRAQNNAGNTLIGNAVFLLNKEDRKSVV